MNETALASKRPSLNAQSLLSTSGKLWFLAALIGQWMFVAYIIQVFARPSLAGQSEKWNDTGLIHGYIAGDLLGNVLFLVHVLLAAVITFGGTLQLIPQIRKHAIGFHRWNGRVFMICAYILAIGGIYMIWGHRETRLNDLAGLATTLNGVLIVIAATVALRLAMTGRIDAHRQWAMRLFILVNGVWFFRVFLMGWLMANQGPLGNTQNLDGPADLVIAFGSYLIPLFFLEIYLRASRSRSNPVKLTATGLTLIATLVTAFGSFAASMMLWLPNMG